MHVDHEVREPYRTADIAGTAANTTHPSALMISVHKLDSLATTVVSNPNGA